MDRWHYANGIVPIAGVTGTGMNDDIEGLDGALEEYNAKTGHDIPIHVDAASGGSLLAFIIYAMRKPSWRDPETEFAPFHWEQKESGDNQSY